ncbi:ALA-interacting subunit 3-like [Olea europaea var. sylvestris]|nr:ALA-interacting subunit 3-like [Olea europaea var. sylvestris]
MNSNSPSTSAGGPGSADSTAPRRNSKRPKYSRFTQQELPACKPILTPKWVISAFLLVSIVFIPIGLVSLFDSQDVVEIIDRYETDCIPLDSRNDKVGFIQSPQDKTCHRNLTVPKLMKRPIYVYYQLDNFYQNHRRYVKSRSDQQLRNPGDEGDTSACEPEDTAHGMPIVPCGLIAWSLFNDTYNFTLNNLLVTINKTGISWKSDKDHKNIPLSEQEDLIVWMRTAALPTFRKLYGKIEVDLQAGDVINVELQNNYNTYSFDGKKKLVLSTTSWLGGKNDFLGIAYLVVGGLCFFLSLVFTIIYLVKPSIEQLSEQEDLIVWMRTAALPTFRKLYGKIEVDLQAGDVINVELQNNYNTYSFDGKKKLVLSTTSWLGGKNDFLGIAYLVVGGLCFFLSLVFTIIYLVKPRKLGDPSYLSWNRNPGGH